MEVGSINPFDNVKNDIKNNLIIDLKVFIKFNKLVTKSSI